MAAKKKKAPPILLTPTRARAKEEKNLEALARQMQKARLEISTAAALHGDGAYESARARLAKAVSLACSVIRRINLNKWHVEANS